MAINLGFTKLAGMDPSVDIPASLHPNMEMTDIVIAAGQNLKRGACLGYKMPSEDPDSGKYFLWDTSAIDGTQMLAGILGCDVDATDADGKGFMYVHGEFLKSALYATQDIEAGVFGFGAIVIKEDRL